jgi:hypothetical protein
VRTFNALLRAHLLLLVVLVLMLLMLLMAWV